MISIDNISWNKEIMNSRLEFDITGINHNILNTFRRVMLTNIPIFSFNNITISENTSVFNNNYMKLRISNMPVFGIHSDEPIFTKIIPVKVKEVEIEQDITDDSLDAVNSSSLKQLTMYIDYVNNTTNIVTVGTDDCKFYFAEKQIPSPYAINIPIIKLQSKQKIKLSAITQLGIEETSSIFSPVSIFAYKKLEENKYTVMIESRGQLNEKVLLDYTHTNIQLILDNFIKLIPDRDDIMGKILINDADHTLGNIIAEGLQNHKKVKFGGSNSPHLLDKKIMVHYELYEKGNIKDIMVEIIDEYKLLFESIHKVIKKNIN